MTSPTTKLQIGDGTVDSDNVLKLGKRVSSSESNLPVIGHHSDGGSSSSLALCATSSSGKIHFFTGNNSAGFGAGNNAERMRIDNNGKLTVYGLIDCIGTSGRGAKLGNLSVGYDNLYNTVQSLANSTNLHLQYSVNGDIQCNEGGGDMVTADIKPRTNATFDLGTSTVGWRNIYTNDLHLNNLSKENGNDVDGTNGSWVIQEGKDDLYIINKLNGKKYRIPLEEVDKSVIIRLILHTVNR